MFAESYGQPLDSFRIEKGLQEINPDIHFDVGGKLNLAHPFIKDRQGVWHKGQHVCSMDRGMIPEFKEWTMEDCIVEVPWSERDKEDVWETYIVVPSDVPDYDELCLKASKGTQLGLRFREDGKLVRTSLRSVRKAPGRVTKVGWRHTFERLLLFGVPKVTREALSAKFGVNMDMRPADTPEGFFMSVVAEGAL